MSRLNNVAIKLMVAVCALSALPVFGQVFTNRYAVFLKDAPATARFSSKDALQSKAAVEYRANIEAAQRTLKSSLEARKFRVVGSVSTVLNAVFVVATADRVDELKSMPGVAGVMPMRRGQKHLNTATQLMNAPAAWTALGGVQNAGAGVKIAILDTGIDQTHPAFQDSNLSVPSGYPKCTPGDCAYTNSKVIVARSYVKQIGAGTDPKNPAADSRPDDFSARDHDGHGTAVASSAAANTNTGTVTFTGMAPKAYLGNYKIYGTTGVNDYPPEDVWIQAIEDVVNDGMDVANLSSGVPAISGPLDVGSVCGNSTGVPCDPLAQAFENAAKGGLVITVSAGNSGSDGANYPTFNSVSSPANAPSVIAVGATTNSHVFTPGVTITAAGAPSSVQNQPGQLGDSFGPYGATVGPLVDATQTGNDGYGCSPFPGGSLSGAFVLIERGPATNPCTFDVKTGNAVKAGAVGVVFYMADGSAPISPSGLSAYSIPTVMVSNATGLALKSYVDANPRAASVIDPAAVEQAQSGANQLATYSSLGPNSGDFAIKPDIVATGGFDPFYFPPGLYLAAENYDPSGELYSENRYIAADGTSFSSPITAGAAALVKKAHPSYTAAQIKAALLNTAAQDVTTDDQGAPVTIEQVGAGRLDAGAAVGTTVLITPATLTYGSLTSTTKFPNSQAVTITNTGSAAVTLNVSVAPGTTTTTAATIGVDKTSVSVPAGGSATVNVALSGALPAAGSYSGTINFASGSTTWHVPYIFLVGDGVPSNVIPLAGTSIDGIAGTDVGPIAFKVVDQFGVPVANSQVALTVSPRGSLTLNSLQGAPACSPASSTSATNCPTDSFGNAYVDVVLGTDPTATPTINAKAAGTTIPTDVTIRAQPTISNGGVVNAASNTSPIAPGSYVSIYGQNLADAGTADLVSGGPFLPLMRDSVTVSVDVPSANLSLPARLFYVSPTQVNVQVPWELAGQTSAQVKITINELSYGNVVTVPVAAYSPAFFVGGGVLSSLDSSYRIISASHPAVRGQLISLFGNGFGPVSHQPEDGGPAPSNPLAETTTQPTVTIGGQPAQVQFSGLAPGFAALYQVNVYVPQNISAGTQPVLLTIGGQTTPAASIPVQ